MRRREHTATVKPEDAARRLGWVMEREPFRRFRNLAADRTLIPREDMSDEEAWKALCNKEGIGGGSNEPR